MSAPPGPATPTRTLTFPSSGGTTLYGEWFEAPSPRGHAVVVHGWAEHSGRYRETAHALVQAGVSVFTFDLRGHGQASGRRGHVAAFTEYLDDVDAALAKARALAGDGPRVIVAHSMGSLVTLRGLTDPVRRPDVKAAVVSSPFLGLRLQVPAVKRAAGRVMSRIYPAFSLHEKLRVEDLTADKGKQDERLKDTLCHDSASARWFTEATAAQAYVFDHAGAVVVPTCWLVGGDDHIADPAKSRAVHARLGTPGVFHDLVGLQHEVFNEVDRVRVFGLLTDFVTAQLAAKA